MLVAFQQRSSFESAFRSFCIIYSGSSHPSLYLLMEDLKVELCQNFTSICYKRRVKNTHLVHFKFYYDVVFSIFLSLISQRLNILTSLREDIRVNVSPFVLGVFNYCVWMGEAAFCLSLLQALEFCHCVICCKFIEWQSSDVGCPCRLMMSFDA